MQSINIARRIREAADLIRHSANWTVGVRRKRVGEEIHAYCALGAFDYSDGGIWTDESRRALQHLASLITPEMMTEDDPFNVTGKTGRDLIRKEDGTPHFRDGLTPENLVAWFNNTHTHDEVIDLFDRAAAAASEEVAA